MVNTLFTVIAIKIWYYSTLVDHMMFVVDWCSGRCSHDNRLALPLTYDSDTTLGEVAIKVSILP